MNPFNLITVQNRFKLSVALIGLAATSSVVKADLNAYAYPNAGTTNPVTYVFTATAATDFTAYFAGSFAGYDNQLGMLVNGVISPNGFGLDNHASSIGQSFNLGHANAGDVLTFVMNVNGGSYVYSDPALNTAYDSDGSVGHNHVFSQPYTYSSDNPDIPTGFYIGFEDLPFPGSDFNYQDENFVIAAVAVTEVPEPAHFLGWALLLLPLGMSALRTKAGQKRVV